jgi:glycerol-3-phosphate dehydrogenase
VVTSSDKFYILVDYIQINTYNRSKRSERPNVRGEFMGNKLNSIKRNVQKNVNKDIECTEWHSSIILSGRVSSWDEVILAGKLAANKGYKGVVNRISVENLIIPEIKKPLVQDSNLEGKKVDVLIIGGGIIGCAIGRELSKWDIKVLLLDKEEDVAMHASSRNDGMVHPGIASRLGSKKSIFNVRGNMLYPKVAEELQVEIEKCGSIVAFDKRWIKLIVPFMMQKAKMAGIGEVSYLNKRDLKLREPNISDKIEGAVLFGSAAVVSPYKMTVAYAENAICNGMEISLNTIVKSIEKEADSIVTVTTNRGTIYPKIVINAAGVYADSIADMAGDQFFTIHPRKGEIVLLDKKKGGFINSIIAKPSTSLRKGNTKGGGIIKTIDGNILVGPDAYEEPFKEDYSTNRENIDKILRTHLPLIKGLSPADVITYCAGTRAATYEEDFIIEKSEYLKNMIYAAGIQSPGFASAPAIAEEIERITIENLCKDMKVRKKENWNSKRQGIPDLSRLSFEERSKLIKKRPDYGEIICRCEEISRGEIIDAIKSPLPVRTVDGIKRRVRAGMGRCQGGFCMPLVMEIIKEETGQDIQAITKKGKDSNIVVGETKNNLKSS